MPDQRPADAQNLVVRMGGHAYDDFARHARGPEKIRSNAPMTRS